MKRILTLLASAALGSLLVCAQPGTLDTSFNPGTGANGTVLALELQPDGKVIIAGDFTFVNGTTRNRIARLNNDGTVDNTFNLGSGANNQVFALALQDDGKILIGGLFTNVAGTGRNRIARLNADGTLDNGFNPGTGANDEVNDIVVQPDGKVLISGSFISVNGAPRSRIARLNADGTVDTEFLTGNGVNNNISAMALQPDGKIIIGGYFDRYSSMIVNSPLRLNENGTLDTTFDPGSGIDHPAFPFILALVLQPDGKVIIGGEFDEYNGVPCNYIARINTDGTLDESFVASSETVFALALQPDGMIITGGFGFMERFTSSGVLDTGFDTGTSVDNTIFTLALQTDGKIMVAGDFENYNGTPRSKTLRVNGDGMTVGMQELNTDANTLMLYPNPTTGGNVWIEMPEGLEGAVHIELIQADGRIAHSARSQAHIIAGSNAHHAFDIDAALPQGTYFVRLTSAQRVHTGTVVIAH